MPGDPPNHDRWPFSIDLEDLDDVAGVDELELPPRSVDAAPAQPSFAVGSEVRTRVAVEFQPVPSELDVALMAYLLDIDILSAPAAPASSTDGAIDETPTPRMRP